MKEHFFFNYKDDNGYQQRLLSLHPEIFLDSGAGKKLAFLNTFFSLLFFNRNRNAYPLLPLHGLQAL
jgi:hypothetical protein